MSEKLSGYRCESCGLIIWLPQVYCPDCRKNTWAVIELSGKGELTTYTEIYSAPAKFSKQAPYMIGIARLNDGVNVIGRIEASDLSSLSVGFGRFR